MVSRVLHRLASGYWSLERLEVALRDDAISWHSLVAQLQGLISDEDRPT
jgi:hypothetical protein